MEFELSFNGPPENFLEMIDVFSARCLMENPPFLWMVDSDGYNFVYLWDVLQKERTGAWIKAQNAPNNQSILIVHSPEDKWSLVEKLWIALKDELDRQGWFSIQLETELKSDKLEGQNQPSEPNQTMHRKREPNIRTQNRFNVFKRIKGEHPEWSQAKVAMEAFGELKEAVTFDTVRNTYRLMGEKWQRGDRTR